MANRVIADAQALLVKTKGEYELMMKRLDDLEAKEQRQTTDIQAREEQIDEVDTRVDDALSVSEEELHRVALGDALEEHADRLRIVEERLRSIGGVALPPSGLS